VISAPVIVEELFDKGLAFFVADEAAQGWVRPWRLSFNHLAVNDQVVFLHAGESEARLGTPPRKGLRLRDRRRGGKEAFQQATIAHGGARIMDGLQQKLVRTATSWRLASAISCQCRLLIAPVFLLSQAAQEKLPLQGSLDLGQRPMGRAPRRRQLADTLCDVRQVAHAQHAHQLLGAQNLPVSLSGDAEEIG